jgi:hypothetical protein
MLQKVIFVIRGVLRWAKNSRILIMEITKGDFGRLNQTGFWMMKKVAFGYLVFCDPIAWCRVQGGVQPSGRQTP